MRAQLSLPALGLAFLVLTAVTVLGIAVADNAVVSSERSALDRQAAVALSDRLVSTDGPLAVRANVLDASAVAKLNQTSLRAQYGLSADADARITLDGDEIVSTGEVDSDPSIERLVVVEERRNRTITPSFRAGNSVILPRRTDRIQLSIRPSANATVSTVRIGERIVLHNKTGLYGKFVLSVSRLETAEISFESNTSLSSGSVSLTYYPVETRKARLGVSVDG